MKTANPTGFSRGERIFDTGSDPRKNRTTKDMDDEIHLTPIQQFYRNQSVFVTGATGFIGHALLHKLLTSCIGIRNIYVILREKKGEDISTRLNKILSDQIFDKFRNTSENGLHLLDKVIPVNGDISHPGLGLSEKDMCLLRKEVSIVFHAAATVRFDDELKAALRTNFIGTQNIIKLCKTMSNLKALVYFSTAYSQFHETHIEEQLYPPTIDPEDMAKIPALLDKDDIKTIESLITGKWPNTYILSKNLAEYYVTKCELPVAIIRPSVVVSAWKEPTSGWTNSINGPMKGNIIGSFGILRVVFSDANKVIDIVPVDMVTNAALAIAWKTTFQREETNVYNFVSSAQNAIKWSKCNELCHEFAHKFPPSKAIWCYSVYMVTNKFLFLLLSYMLHYIPAYIMDNMPFFPKGPIRLMDAYAKIDKQSKLTECFQVLEWKFNDQNVRKLYHSLSLEDKTIFDFDIKNVNWREFSSNYMAGLRLYILKEDISTLPAARRRYKMFHAIGKVFQISSIFILCIATVAILKFFF